MNMRGLFPSLGAGGSLIAAAVCALAVFGGVLTFRGENPGTAEADSGDIVVAGREVRAQTSSPGLVSTALSLAATARSAARAEAPRRLQTRHRTTLRRGATVRRGGGTRPRTGGTPSTPAPGPSGSRGGDSIATPTPNAPPPSAPPAKPELSKGTVEHAVEQTRGAVQPVVDAVPQPVQAPVEQVADTVEDVAGTVDETVEGVTGILLPKP